MRADGIAVLVARPEGVAGVLDQTHARAAADCREAIEVTGTAGEVDGDHELCIAGSRQR